jgi:hypothetical protein
MADYSKVFDQPAANPVNYADYPDWERIDNTFEMRTTGTGIGAVDGVGYDSFVYTGVSGVATHSKIVIDSYDDTIATTGIMINATYDPAYFAYGYLLVYLLPAGGLAICMKRANADIVATITNAQGGGPRNTDTFDWTVGDELEILTKRVGEYTTVVPTKNGVVYEGWTLPPQIGGAIIPNEGSCGVYAYNSSVPNFGNAIRSFEVTNLDKNYQLYPDTFLLKATLSIIDGYPGGLQVGLLGFSGYPLDVLEGIPTGIFNENDGKFLKLFGLGSIGDGVGSNILTLLTHSPLTNPIAQNGPKLEDQIRSLHLNGSRFSWSMPVAASNPSLFLNNTYNFILGSTPWVIDYGTPITGEIAELIIEVDASFLGLSGGGGGSGGGGDITPRHFAETLTGEKI